MQSIFLVRHGESVWNRDGRVQGYQDSPLSDLGEAQARRIGKRLKKETIHHVASSTAKRAVESCRLALGKRVEIELSDKLREINLGVWEGRKLVDLRLQHPRQTEMWYRSPSRVKIKGGEPLRSFRVRITREMNRLRAQNENKTFAVFTHGGVICAYLTSLLGMKLDDIWSFKILNGSITKIIFPEGRSRIALLSDVHHLDGCERFDPKSAHRVFP